MKDEELKKKVSNTNSVAHDCIKTVEAVQAYFATNPQRTEYYEGVLAGIRMLRDKCHDEKIQTYVDWKG